MDIKLTFQDYLSTISSEMTNQDSVFQKQSDKIEEQFIKFGLTNEQFAEIMSALHSTTSQFVTQQANASSIELLRLELNQPMFELELEIKRKDLEIKDKELALKDKELEIKDKQLEMMQIDAEIKKQELEIKREELEIARQELELKKQLLEESKAKTKLILEQVITEGFNQKMTAAQTKLVERQELGYNDNLYIKAAEYQGSLASFAVNAAPSNPTTNTAIRNFTTTINEIKQRGA